LNKPDVRPRSNESATLSTYRKGALPAVLHVATRSLDIPHAPLTVLLYSGLAHQSRRFAAQNRDHSAALLALLRHEQVAAGHHAAALLLILLILNIKI
jgi:hypothetical protein